MDKEADHRASMAPPLDCHLVHHHTQHGSTLQDESAEEGGIEMVDYVLSSPAPLPPPQAQISFDRLSFSDVVQFADFGPRLSLNQSKASEDENFFLKFHVLGDKLLQEEVLPPPPPPPPPPQPTAFEEDKEGGGEEGRLLENVSLSQQQLSFVGQAEKTGVGEVKNRRKRPRSMKTSEEVESQRMTHIAVERNRRRQMNEYLRVLRSLMPGSYVQRGDQASIIGGAIEFVRELEQLLQCLESQKRRRLYGSAEAPRTVMDAAALVPVQHQPLQQQQQQQQQQPFYPFPDDNVKILDLDPTGALREEMAENKSCLADIEVRLLGFDAMIKILSRRRPGQLLKIIAALEDLQFSILHTNITTIEQTVLYSFNVKIIGETGCAAEDIANSVQQILSFIEANTI
ncbi:transcription factor FAMA [Ananas comosus]|uniref:Transcription factor FAMA n=1 Tax=Ananas comosus TaxID=4615 RepID=A0A6P5GTM5_ANACO|nr:transcription factor FAMA [Ananas comosus]